MRNIVLKEDFAAVAHPVCHVQGLVPFCVENPKLRIERHVGLLSNLLLDGYGTIYNSYGDFIMGTECLAVMVAWIEEAASLLTYGMPQSSFQLVIEGATRESSEAWELLKFAAATHEARLELCRRANKDPPPRPNDPRYFNEVDGCWNLPIGFSQTIRDIMNGTWIIRYDGDVGEIWDQDMFLIERADWTQRQWEMDWEEKLLYYSSETSFWSQVPHRYSIKPEPLASTCTMKRNGVVIIQKTSNGSGALSSGMRGERIS